MNYKKLSLSAGAIAAMLAITGAGVAIAKSGAIGDENDAVADLAKARISLAQAIATAEQHAGGSATSGELETEHGRIAFEVEVVAANNAVYDVMIDAVSGKVLKSELDKADAAEDSEGKEQAD